MYVYVLCIEWVKAKTAHKLTLILFSRSEVEVTESQGDQTTTQPHSSTSSPASSTSSSSPSPSPPPSLLSQYVSHTTDSVTDWLSTSNVPMSVSPSNVINVDVFGRTYQDHYMTILQGDTTMHRDPSRLINALKPHL